jgi:hypothetical protein
MAFLVSLLFAFFLPCAYLSRVYGDFFPLLTHCVQANLADKILKDELGSVKVKVKMKILMILCNMMMILKIFLNYDL